jgi:error-prone DNA polymerase
MSPSTLPAASFRTGFAEAVAASNFSFLAGASHPGEMVERALALGMTGLGLADRNSVAGVVRAHSAWKTAQKEGRAEGFKLIVGARLVFADDTPDVVAYPMTRRGWGRLTRLLSLGNLRAKKGDCILYFDDLLEWAEEMALVILPGTGRRQPEALTEGPGAAKLQHQKSRMPSPDPSTTSWSPSPFRGGFALLRNQIPNIWLGAAMHRTGTDKRRFAELRILSHETGIPLIATNDALYASPAERPLHDVLTCIREKVTIHQAGTRLAANAERYLKSPAEMARLFADVPEAIMATADLFNAVNFTLDELAYEYPHEPVPMGWTPQAWLEELVWSAIREKFPDGVPPRWQTLLQEELGLIGRLNYAAYFLTVYDIVNYARAQDPPILCQGRGSAANSAVCYLLGVTAVDPVENNLLFSRFLSEERAEPPDIDVDFEHERREEVMQYVYRRYGRHRAGIVATVIHYRPKSTLREVGKALGFSEDVTARLAGTIWGSWGGEVEEARIREAGFDPDNREIRRMRHIVARILNFPRHLSQHVGGFVLTEDRLDETVPILNAAMDDRTFIEWDKDDIDALGLMKVDVLALGMLTCIRKSLEMIEAQNIPLPQAGGDRGGGERSERYTLSGPPPTPPACGRGEKRLSLTSIPPDDPAVYDMLCKGDSIGVFQVESRAQINMLPRLRPRELYDLVVQVAIVRPGPIEGEMVHPYLRRRQGLEPVDFPSPAPPHDPGELKEVLGRTYGVPLFQEQAMKLAIVAAEFTPDEANGLRRAMATFRNLGTIDQFKGKMVGRMMARGYTQDFAERCFKQIEGFGSYGFPESHAQSFALLVYISSWIKCHHPAVFAAALLNSQPMGFYAPAQIVRDAVEHGVEVLPMDVNASGWDNGVIQNPPQNGEVAVAQQLTEGERRPTQPCLRPPAPSTALSAVPLPVPGRISLRLGLRQIDGFREDWAKAIACARMSGPFTDIESLAARAMLNDQALKLLADADALRSLGLDRRQALWEVHRRPGPPLPLFAAADARELAAEADAMLPAMALSEHVAADYQTHRLSLKGHPMQFLRGDFGREGVLSCAAVNAAKNGLAVKAAGVVLIRQRPGKGNAIFITIEDESGVVNILLWARLLERQRRAVMASRLMEVHGEVQRSKEGVVHLMAHSIIDRSAELGRLSETHATNPELARADEVNRPQAPRSHPRNVRILPKSRDFH